MKQINDPRQTALFDSYQTHLSEVGYARILKGWQGVFRHAILEVLPVDELAEHFSADQGRPTKELYSMAGLLLIMEFKNWTVEEAAEAYMYSTDIQYALNLGRDNQSMTERTIERYQRLFRQDGLAMTVMDRVSEALVKELDLDIRKQRLDSTHVFSNMATFTRTRMMGVVIKRFLVQLKRHHQTSYRRLPQEFRQRYSRSESGLFGDVKRDQESRQALKQQVAEDLYMLIERFAQSERVTNRKTYKDMVKVFEQQCELTDKNVKVKKKTGNQVMQNPSDPDATYDGCKGPGYQVQLSETCSEENEVQLITCAIPQKAHEQDSDALSEVVENLETKKVLPEELIADTHYGSDDNVGHCAEKGVELVSPVAGPPPKNAPAEPTEKQQRLQKRREVQETEAWRDRYRIRAGIEGTNSGAKRKTGMGKLRVRGRPSVNHAILMKVAGWNILRAACAKKMEQIVFERSRKDMADGAVSCLRALLTASTAVRKAIRSLSFMFSVRHQPHRFLSPFAVNI
jgi:hypothetical protein